MKQILFAAALVALPMSAYAGHGEHSMEQSKEMFKECDSNSDGKISKDEFSKEKMAKFDKYDKNNDGALSMDEHEKMAMEKRQDMKEKADS